MPESVYEIFERLNTGGMPLTEQEVRNCVNSGTINAFLDTLNKTESWRALLGKLEPDRRMKDIEIILRVLALVDDCKNYKKPMKDFISAYMEKHVNISKEEQEKLGTFFKATTDMIKSQVGSSAFRLSGGRVNVAVLDSVMTAVATIGPSKIKDFKNRLENLKTNGSYSDYVSKSTTDDDAVKGRIKMSIETFIHKA